MPLWKPLVTVEFCKPRTPPFSGKKKTTKNRLRALMIDVKPYCSYSVWHSGKRKSDEVVFPNVHKCE